MTITGGTAVVSGPTANNNAAVDYDAGLEITGGTLIAAGSLGMAQAPSDNAKQYSAVMYFTSSQKAGTFVTLKDSSVKTIASYGPNKEFPCKYIVVVVLFYYIYYMVVDKSKVNIIYI
ncbi:MAG: hypothetical protein Q8936_20495 [Bacillota bacterium]|nr:hypothetical protein [Bacillota bacterium]